MAAAERLAAYWDRFPNTGAHLTQKQKVDLLHNGPLNVLEQEIDNCARVNSKLNVEIVVRNAFRYIGGWLERLIATLWPRLYYIRGTVQDLLDKKDVDVELAEIAIDLQPYFAHGPYVRLAYKLGIAIMTRQVLSSFSSSTIDVIKRGDVKVSPEGPVPQELDAKYRNM